MAAPESVEGQQEPTPDDFSGMLAYYRKNVGLSRNHLARLTGVDPSYLTRLEHGDRDPPRRYIIEALIERLHLVPPNSDKLLLAAGYAPSVLKIPGWDDTLMAVISVYNNPRLSPSDIDEFKATIREIANRWNQAGVTKPS